MKLQFEEIHGFASIGEYERFCAYVVSLVASGAVAELPADKSYGQGMIYGGRWFKDVETDVIWRLVPPDPPFLGLWEPVVS